MSSVVKDSVMRVIIVNRKGFDCLGDWDEMPIKRTFRNKKEAVKYCEEHYGTSELDRSGWRVERQFRKG